VTLVLALWTHTDDYERDDRTLAGDHGPTFTPHHRLELLPVMVSMRAL
jgi:hypothetical protein